ncbi:MAG TPA: DUF3592 domain-containing protein, partial [Actinomycetota bacterium]|nr:DUF3592 domain-containing protein [Actinomycetota bacterium]
RLGRRVPGEVVAYTRSPHQLVIRFEWKGSSRLEHIRLSEPARPYRPGDPVTVVIDPNDEQHLTVVGEANDPEGLLLVSLLTAIGGLPVVMAGLVILGRAARQRRVLRAHAWRRVPAYFIELRVPLAKGEAVRSLLQVDTSILTLAPTNPLRTARSGIREAKQMDVAGDPKRYLVIRPVGSTVLLSARAPRLSYIRRVWNDAYRHGNFRYLHHVRGGSP